MNITPRYKPEALAVIEQRIEAGISSRDIALIEKRLAWVRGTPAIPDDYKNRFVDTLTQALDALRKPAQQELPAFPDMDVTPLRQIRRTNGDTRLLDTAERIISQAAVPEVEDIPEVPEVRGDGYVPPATPDEAMQQAERLWTQQDVEQEMAAARAATGSRVYRAREPVFLVKIIQHELGNERKLRKNEYEVAGTTKDRTNATKTLIDKEFFKPMNALANKYTCSDGSGKIDLLALPVPFKGGFKPIPISNMKRFYELLKEWRRRLKALGEEHIIPNYPDEVRKSAIALGPRFVAGDYVSPKVAAAKFSIDVDYYTPGVPEGLAAVGEEFLSVEMANAEHKSQEMYARTEDALAVSLEKMTEKLLASVSGGKKFYDTDVTKFTDFLSAFTNRNITGNERLAAIAEKAEKVLRGVDVKSLKKDDRMKEYLGAAMSEVAEETKKYLKEKPMRLVSVSDDTDEVM